MMEIKFNKAKTLRPEHLERCLCWDKFEKSYRCYVYDDISKYWCTQATTEHDPNGDNHIVDYADYQVTDWASLPNVNKSSLPSNLDDAAEESAKSWRKNPDGSESREVFFQPYIRGFKAGAEWMARQGASYNTEVGWIDGPTILDWPNDILDKFEMGDEVIVQIRKK